MDAAARLEALRGASAFAGLAADALGALAARTTVRPFGVGEPLIRQGEAGDALWLLVAGRAVVRLRGRGGSTTELAHVAPGDVVGEMALVTGSPRNADVVATAPGHALLLARDAFEEIAAQHPSVLGLLTDLTAARLGRAAQDGLADKVLEGYRIVRPVGRGATAVVYEAEELATGRRTALKMLSHRFARDRAQMEWFEREAKLLDAVSHPGIARAWGRFHAYGTCFLAIQFVDGASAHDVLRRRGRVPVDDAVAIVGTVLDALRHVHERGIVHGDVKPANVMLDREGRSLLTDFGIASRVDGADAAQRIVGTPRYMAPELFVGRRPSPASDLYALGCVLFELLEGRPAFGAEALGLLVLSKRNFEGIAEDDMEAAVPAPLRGAVSGLLHPEPQARLDTAASLILPPGLADPALVTS